MRIPFISLVAAGSLALGGCAYGNLGVGLGYGSDYGSYGYYGSPYYRAGYSPWYGGYGYGYDDPWYGGYRRYGSPYYGWYDNYYYPGTGIYVYDNYRRPRVWSDRQRSYWSSRQLVTRSAGTQVTTAKPNWSGFTRQQRMSTGEERQRERRRD